MIKAWSCSEYLSTKKFSGGIKDDELLFSSIGQLNFAGPLAGTAEVAVDVATYNLVAAKKAITMSDFSSAAAFLNHGIGFLNQNQCWRYNYKLILELHELSAKVRLDFFYGLTYSIISQPHSF